MTDNVVFVTGDPATPPVNTTVAADVIGGVAYQRMKPVHGADGSATDTSTTDPLPIQVRDSSGTELGTNTDPIRTDPTGDTAQPVTDNGGSLTVDNGGTFAVQAAQSGTWNITNVSGTISLPTGAATAAKQPALGTAGTASSDVISVQGIASMTPITVDGSGVTQPVSGTVTANAGTGSFTVAQATATNLKAQVVGTGTFAVQAAQSGTWNVGTVTTLTGITNVVHVDDNASTLSVDDGAGSLTVDNGGTFAVQASTATSGGTSISTGTVGATKTSIKASAGQLYGWHIYNSNSSAVYVQIFNATTGNVTLGTTAPTISLGIPATGGATVSLPTGIAFSTAMSFAVTTTRSGSTGPSSTVDVNFFYA